ncbi:MAG TPA: DUF4169 family protein [Rhizomicrobium sp.]|nr:DUF4169 family protein [Rhizomicrobium sp.]
MTDIINLRRARKNKARAAKAAKADANRATHGVAKSVRDLVKARREKAERIADAHKLDEQ